jgi:hypothetical protein
MISLYICHGNSNLAASISVQQVTAILTNNDRIQQVVICHPQLLLSLQEPKLIVCPKDFFFFNQLLDEVIIC